MAVHKLRNGLTIDLTFDKPTIFEPRPATIDFDQTALYKSMLDAHPRPIDARGQVIPQTNVIKMRAAGTVTGASDDVLNKCTLRFIQVVKVQSFNVTYHGKRPDEGTVRWAWQGDLLLRNIDSLVNPDGTTTSPFQFDLSTTERQPPNVLIAKMGDTPGATIPLSELNRTNSKDNYLFIFNDRRRFESIVTFVHPDGSREMLESWKWNFVRAVKLKWNKLKPEIDGSNTIRFAAETSPVTVFGKDAEFNDTLSSGRIANKLTNDAMANIRTSPNIDYAPASTTTFSPPPTFWTP